MLGTLWPVSDAATALLIAKFYELHMEQRLSPPAALRQAQLWLSKATGDEIDAYSRGAVALGRMESRHLAEIEQELSTDATVPAQDRAAAQEGDPSTGHDGRSEPGEGTLRAPVLLGRLHPYRPVAQRRQNSMTKRARGALGGAGSGIERKERALSGPASDFGPSGVSHLPLSQ